MHLQAGLHKPGFREQGRANLDDVGEAQRLGTTGVESFSPLRNVGCVEEKVEVMRGMHAVFVSQVWSVSSVHSSTCACTYVSALRFTPCV